MNLPRSLLLVPLAAVVPLLVGGGSTLVSAPTGPAASFAPSPAWSGLAHPRDWVRIGGGGASSHVVPAGKVFVLTALGTPDAFNYGGTGGGGLVLNGAKALATQTLGPYGPTEALHPVEMLEAPVGWTAQAGDLLSLVASTTSAWGYEVDASGPGSAGLVVPHPKEWMRLQGSYVVPAGKLFVVTAVGTTELFMGITVGAQLQIGGNTQVTFEPTSWAPFVSVCPIPPGLAAGAGQTVSCSTVSGQPGVFLGFLVDA